LYPVRLALSTPKSPHYQLQVLYYYVQIKKLKVASLNRGVSREVEKSKAEMARWDGMGPGLGVQSPQSPHWGGRGL
jgi:hypothetical protein